MDSLMKFVTSLDRATIHHGGHDENENPVSLKAGRLSMIFEKGNLRNICISGHEIVRMIYPALRDSAWLTVRPEITVREFNIGDNSFYIKSLYTYRQGEIDFSAVVSMEGGPDDSIILGFRGEALGSFEKNRIGFCVLHPVKEIAGADCLIKHSNDDLEICKFPVLISPHQPFTDINVMHWNIAGVSCRLDFYGDVFETEDQRNWTDASYKTYSTPLRLPYPVRLQEGDSVNQGIVLRAKEGADFFSSETENIISICSGETTQFPKTGICRSSRPVPLSENEARLIRRLRFDHYRADIFLFIPGWQTIARLCMDEASALDYPLELVLFVDDVQTEAGQFLKWSTGINVKVAVLSVFHKETGAIPDNLSDETIACLRDRFPGVKIAAGTNANFAQLNRKRPAAHKTDLICYSIHPQEHASDNKTMTENLECQSYTVNSACAFAGNRGIWISPVNIRRRFNANIESYEHPSEGIAPQADSRLMSLFGSCWLTGSIKNLFESGVNGVTFLETVGERGIIQGDFDSRWPGSFKSVKGMIFPVFFVFQFILIYKSFRIVKAISSDPLSFEMLVLSDKNEYKFILVNFTNEDKEITIKGISGTFRIRNLDDRTYSEAATNPEWLTEFSPGKIALPGRIKLSKYSMIFGE